MLGKRIADLRRKRGLNQSELAKKLGLSASSIGMYEQGRREPSISTVVALAEQLGVTTDYLLTGQAFIISPCERIEDNDRIPTETIPPSTIWNIHS